MGNDDSLVKDIFKNALNRHFMEVKIARPECVSSDHSITSSCGCTAGIARTCVIEMATVNIDDVVFFSLRLYLLMVMRGKSGYDQLLHVIIPTEMTRVP